MRRLELLPLTDRVVVSFERRLRSYLDFQQRSSTHRQLADGLPVLLSRIYHQVATVQPSGVEAGNGLRAPRCGAGGLSLHFSNQAVAKLEVRRALLGPASAGFALGALGEQKLQCTASVRDSLVRRAWGTRRRRLVRAPSRQRIRSGCSAGCGGSGVHIHEVTMWARRGTGPARTDPWLHRRNKWSTARLPALPSRQPPAEAGASQKAIHQLGEPVKRREVSPRGGAAEVEGTTSAPHVYPPCIPQPVHARRGAGSVMIALQAASSATSSSSLLLICPRGVAP